MNSFFGVQVACDLGLDDRRRTQLTDLVRDHRKASEPTTQRQAWSRAASLLSATRPAFGTWDLLRDRADENYAEWSQDLEAMAGWSTSAFGSNGRHLLVSLILLVESGSAADETLGTACDLPESRWHTRATYLTLLGLPSRIDQRGVVGCGLYIAPRPDRPGFSTEVLRSEDFNYLAAVV